jgi:hypothetical protein
MGYITGGRGKHMEGGVKVEKGVVISPVRRSKL